MFLFHLAWPQWQYHHFFLWTQVGMHCQLGPNRGILQNWMFLCFILASATIPPFPPLNTNCLACCVVANIQCGITTGNHHSTGKDKIGAWMLWYRMQYTLAWSWSVWRPASHVGYVAIKLILHTQFNKTICYAFPSDFSNIASQQQQKQQLTNHWINQEEECQRRGRVRCIE